MTHKPNFNVASPESSTAQTGATGAEATASVTAPEIQKPPFALPLRASKSWKWYIDDASGSGALTVMGDVSKPLLSEQRDYVISAVNSFPLPEEMREALRLIRDHGLCGDPNHARHYLV